MSAVKSNQFANSVSFRVLKSEILGIKDTQQLLRRYLASGQQEDTSFHKSGNEDTLSRLEILLENLSQPGMKETPVVDHSGEEVGSAVVEGSSEKEKKREKKRKHEAAADDANNLKGSKDDANKGASSKDDKPTAGEKKRHKKARE